MVLVHGIRTRAIWQAKVRPILEDNGFLVEPTNYGRFDLFRFLLPISYFRRKVQQKLALQIRAVRRMYPDAEMSIIAHSFGTYTLANILQNEIDFPKCRIILLGSIVREDFPFLGLSDRYKGKILNEVGARDPWPVMAESTTTGYGYSGTFGFRTPHTFDHFTDGNHASCLSEANFENVLLPYLLEGTPPPQSPIESPYWIHLISLLKIKYLIVLLLLFLTLTGWLRSMHSSFDRSLQISGESGWTLDMIDLDENALEFANRRCIAKAVYEPICKTRLWAWMTGREWIAVRMHELDDLQAVRFSSPVDQRFNSPIEFWKYLAGDRPDCVSLIERSGSVSILRTEQCTD